MLWIRNIVRIVFASRNILVINALRFSQSFVTKQSTLKRREAVKGQLNKTMNVTNVGNCSPS